MSARHPNSASGSDRPARADSSSARPPLRPLPFVCRALAGATLISLLGCASAPPPPARQVQEYQRHTTVGLEKYGDGFIGEARNAFRRALSHAELDDSHERIASALLNLGASELLLDEPEAGGQAFARAAREAAQGQRPSLEWQALCGLAEATRRLGQPGQAVALYERLPPASRPSEAHRLWPAEIARALALAEAGRADEGLALLAQGENPVRGLGPNNATLGSLLLARARIHLQRKELPAAAAAGYAALENDRALHHPPSVADDHYWLGQIEVARQENTVGAADHLQRAARIFARTGQTKRLARTEEALLALRQTPTPR
jgi:tetratricopeptide (TPR) repeat protein